MLLTCPNCETIFRVASHNLKPTGQSVRCSVCTHVWQAQPGKDTVTPEPNDMQEAIKALRLPVLVLVIFMVGVASIAFNRGLITAYMPSLIGAFDVVGLTVRPDLNKLKVTNLSADYSGDNLRLSGALTNVSGWRTHAADLRVTVTSKDGVIMNEVILTPEHKVIDALGATRFFVQLDVEDSASAQEANIVVIPLDNRIFQ